MEDTIHLCDENCNHNKPFINVHCHSSWSLLDGCSSIAGYIKKAKELNHPGLVVTDHGTAAAWFDFHRDVTKAGLKPVLGCEYYFTTNLDNKTPSRKRPLEERDKHQTILVKNAAGYKNACWLNYHSYKEGFYYKPRINYEMLFEHKEGLIATSGCMVSMFSQLVANDNYKDAERWFKRFVEEFGEDFYGEIQFNELTDKNKYGISQKDINDFILDMCKKHSVPHLIGGDTHYVEKEDSKLQDIVLNVSSRRDATSIQENTESFIHARHLYYHSSKDYYNFNQSFGYNYDQKTIIDQAFENSLKVLDKVDFKFDTGKINFPKFTHPLIKNKTNIEILRDIAEEGLFKKLKERKKRGEKFDSKLLTKYQDRLNYELEVIEQKQITDYFLIVQDVVNWSKKNDIQAGIGRGSVGGSLLAYATGITEIDSIKFDLYFERFQNPERRSLPDIDCDFENGGREKIRKYLEEKYGEECVFGVVTFHTFQAKSALEDASRGLGKETAFGSTLKLEITKLQVDSAFIKEVQKDKALQKEIQKTITDIWGGERPLETDNLTCFRPYRNEHNSDWRIDLEEFEHNIEHTKDLPLFFSLITHQPDTTPTVLEWIDENKDVIKWGQKLLGQVKNLGTHAGGILITPGPIYDYIPVVRGSGEIVTAFKEADGSSKDLSELGLLKLDILGLKTLNVIGNSIRQIKRDLKKDITNDVTYLDLEDPKLYEQINKGNLHGIFQFDGGAVDLIRLIKPDCFDDMIAINALNRPGPKETFGALYGKWKRFHQAGTPELCAEDDAYPRLDFMQKVTKRTYYTLCYQEQFMLMVKEAADFNMGEADDFRRMIAWRKDNAKYYLVEKYFTKLEEGMLVKGYSTEDVDYFVDYCKKFLGYSFNAAHSCAYAYTAMQCLYLKTYCPPYFFANLLNSEAHEKYQTIVADALANGIEVLPPSITKSQREFVVVEDDKIRIGFTAIKGCGDKAIQEIEDLKIYECKTIDEILTKPLKAINSKVLQVLVDVGAFDELGIDRQKILSARMLYKEKKIATWFTRKSKKLDISSMPACLMEFPEHIVFALVEEHREKEEPWIPFVTELVNHIPIKTPINDKKKDELAEEILGISLETARKLSKLWSLASQFPTLNLKSLSTREQDKDLCYWFLKEIIKSKTKNGKPYLTLAISDGSISVRAKCWRIQAFTKGSTYISQLKKDMFGYSIIQNESLEEINVDE